MAKKDISHIDLKKYNHATPIQIRFVDIDKLGHVNNATILSYFETARVAYLNDVIGRENDWVGRGLILAHSEIDYLLPVYQDDVIKAYTRVTRIGNKSFDVENVLVKVQAANEVFAAIATGVLVCMDYHAHKTIQLEESWNEKIRNFEKGTL